MDIARKLSNTGKNFVEEVPKTSIPGPLFLYISMTWPEAVKSTSLLCEENYLLIYQQTYVVEIKKLKNFVKLCDMFFEIMNLV